MSVFDKKVHFTSNIEQTQKKINFPKWAFVRWVIIWPDVELLFIFIITLFAFQKSTDKMNMFMKNKQKWRVIQAFMNESKSLSPLTSIFMIFEQGSRAATKNSYLLR